MAKKARKPKVDRGDANDGDSGYRRNTLSRALEKIYGAGSLESTTDPESGATATKSERASRES